LAEVEKAEKRVPKKGLKKVQNERREKTGARDRTTRNSNGEEASKTLWRMREKVEAVCAAKEEPLRKPRAKKSISRFLRP